MSTRRHTSAYVSIREHTSHTSAYVNIDVPVDHGAVVVIHTLEPHPHSLRQYLYFCTKKASKLSTLNDTHTDSTSSCIVCRCCSFSIAARTCIRQHTPAYVSRRRHTHTSAMQVLQLLYRRANLHTSAHVSTRQHTSAYVSIRILQHMQVLQLLYRRQ